MSIDAETRNGSNGSQPAEWYVSPMDRIEQIARSVSRSVAALNRRQTMTAERMLEVGITEGILAYSATLADQNPSTNGNGSQPQGEETHGAS